MRLVAGVLLFVDDDAVLFSRVVAFAKRSSILHTYFEHISPLKKFPLAMRMNTTWRKKNYLPGNLAINAPGEKLLRPELHRREIVGEAVLVRHRRRVLAAVVCSCSGSGSG